jgi:hypothetical protein
MRVYVIGIYYKRKKTTCNYTIGDPCLVKWKNKSENMSGFLHATFHCHCYPCTLSFACNPWLCAFVLRVSTQTKVTDDMEVLDETSWFCRTSGLIAKTIGLVQ